MIAKIRESPVVSGIAVPPPKVPRSIILFGREAPMVSGIAVPPSEFPPPLNECFLKSVPVREAEEGAVVNHGQGVAEVQDQRGAGVARKLYVTR